MSTRPDHARLAHLVEERRQELGVSQRDVAHTTDTYGRIMRGDGIRDSTARRAERALRWAPRSFDRILAGGDPIEIDETPPKIDPRDRRIRVMRDLNGAALAVEDVPEDALTEVEALADRILATLRSHNPPTT